MRDLIIGLGGERGDTDTGMITQGGSGIINILFSFVN